MQFLRHLYLCYVFLLNDPSTTAIYTYGHPLSLHDALPIWPQARLDDAQAIDDGAERHGPIFGHILCAQHEDKAPPLFDTDRDVADDDRGPEIGRAHV